MVVGDALLLGSGNWFGSQMVAWGRPLDGSNTYYFAYTTKSYIALYQVEKLPDETLSQPRFVNDFRCGKTSKRTSCVTFIYDALNELLLVCGGDDGFVQVWNIATLQIVDQHNRHKSEVSAVSSKDNITLVSGDRNGTICVWQRNNGSISLFVPISGDCIYSLEVCPQNHQHVAVGYRSGKLILIDQTTGTTLTRFRGHDEEVHAVQWKPDSETPILCSSSRDKKIRVWKEDNMLHDLTLPQSQKTLSVYQTSRLWLMFCWIPSSKFEIVCSSITGEMYRYEWAANQKKIGAPKLFKHNHSRLVFNIAPLVLSNRNVMLLTNSMDREVRLTVLQTTTCHSKIIGSGGLVSSVSLNCEGSIVAVGVADSTIRLIERNGSSKLLWKGFQGKVTTVSWHPQVPTLLAYGTDEGQIGLYNVQSQNHTRFKSFHRGSVRQVGWYIPAAKQDTASLWMKSLESVKDGTIDLEDAVNSNTSSTASEMWSCDESGELFASKPDSPQNASVALNDLLKLSKATCFAWSSTYDVLCLGTPDGDVCVFGQEENGWIRGRTYMDHKKNITSLAFSSKGNLATASEDATICIYQIENVHYASISHCLTGHGGPVTSLHWSPSGEYLASASFDTTVQVWPLNRTTGYNFRGHLSRVLAVAWFNDEKLVSGGADQSVRKWAFEDQEFSMPLKLDASEEVSVATKKKNISTSNSMFKEAPSADVPLTTALDDMKAQFETDGDFESAARLLILEGRIGEALRLVAQNRKLSPQWLAYAPQAGMNVWREYTRLYATQCREKREFRNGALSYLSIGDVYAAVECFVKGELWQEALSLIELRCAPSDPILHKTTLLYATHLQKLEKWSDAGRLFRSISNHEQALVCFLKCDDTLDCALELMTPESYSLATYVDIATRAIQLNKFDVAQSAVNKLTDDKAEQFVLQAFLHYVDRIDNFESLPSANWPSPSASELWDKLRENDLVKEWPAILQDALQKCRPASEVFWSSMIPLVQNLGDSLDEIETILGGKIDETLAPLHRIKPVEFRIVKSICQMSIELVQDYLIAALETWSACLTYVSEATVDNQMKLFTTCCLVFPFGVTTTPLTVGELETDITNVTEMWAKFFLHQCIGFCRYLSVDPKTNLHARQEALLFLVENINKSLPVSELQELGESVLRAAQMARNDLSLLYHQLKDM
ncbi:hypothetical protein Ae201684P_006570 [Aphanomyces euteiches]|uniref:Gem-associated protein 5 TPR domain-containing protein n=1 Tax=Aphanomyces euteiches TaxID=100861 RepID=A0A6G0XB55_9STRA|nr:hypothetical protein Ae201684_006554 [Aphanomyces euteiches]KAH9091170.1 hypothetical protein Ae201684P_006570 [Aphanomyces euteiches]KAH9157584.1 hypothetical protein AeRB84_000583 [Aphanomyces euteiches]